MQPITATNLSQAGIVRDGDMAGLERQELIAIIHGLQAELAALKGTSGEKETAAEAE